MAPAPIDSCRSWSSGWSSGRDVVLPSPPTPSPRWARLGYEVNRGEGKQFEGRRGRKAPPPPFEKPQPSPGQPSDGGRCQRAGGGGSGGGKSEPPELKGVIHAGL